MRLTLVAASNREYGPHSPCWLSRPHSRRRRFSKRPRVADYEPKGLRCEWKPRKWGRPWIAWRVASVRAKCLCFHRRGSGSSIIVASVGRQVLPTTATEPAPSLLWLATIQCIESEQDLAGLAFIPAKPVERVVGQIGQPQKAACEFSCGINGFRPRAGLGFRFVCNAVRC